MVNDSNRDDPSFDIGFQGLASLGDPGIGPVDIGSVPNTFGSMPGNTPTTCLLYTSPSPRDRG